MKSQHGVSVLCITHNQVAYVAERIQSIADQTIKPAEVVIVDDASTDGTVERLNTAIKGLEGFTMVKGDTAGAPAPIWAEWVPKLSTELVWIAEGDDSCTPGFLETLLPLFRDPDVVLAFSNAEQVDEQGNSTGLISEVRQKKFTTNHWTNDFTAIGQEEVRQYQLHGSTIGNVSAVVFRKSVAMPYLEQVKGFRLIADWVLFSLMALDGKVAYSAQPLNRFRMHSRSLSATKYTKTGLMIKEMLKGYRLLDAHLHLTETEHKVIASKMWWSLNDRGANNTAILKAAMAGLGRYPALGMKLVWTCLAAKRVKAAQ